METLEVSQKRTGQRPSESRDKMRLTSLMLRDSQLDGLAHIAIEEHASKGSIVRRAVHDFLRQRGVECGL
jgi:hypothetical protein